MKSLRLAPEVKKSVEIENREEFAAPIAHQVCIGIHQAGYTRAFIHREKVINKTSLKCHFPAGHLI